MAVWFRSRVLEFFFYAKSEQKVAAGVALITNLELYTVRCWVMWSLYNVTTETFWNRNSECWVCYLRYKNAYDYNFPMQYEYTFGISFLTSHWWCACLESFVHVNTGSSSQHILFGYFEFCHSAPCQKILLFVIFLGEKSNWSILRTDGLVCWFC